MKCIPISIPQNVENELNDVKKEFYSNSSQNEMIRDLIKQGLKVANAIKMTGELK